MILEQIADELVKVTSGLVSGRTINVMNLNGIIIASSEEGRVGTFHQGAEQVVRTGRMVNITKEQLAEYPGAREGCNMPIYREDRMIGVVGIYGNPDEIQDLAHLLQVYTTKYLELETIINQKMEETRVRKKLMYQLLSVKEDHADYAMSLMNELQLHLQFPLCVMVVSDKDRDSIRLQEISEILQRRRYLDSRCDLFMEEGKRLIILKSGAGEAPHRIAEKMYQTVQKEGYSCKISLGTVCSSWGMIGTSYEEACGLDVCAEGEVNDISEDRCRCCYMLHLTAKEQEPYIKMLYERLKQNVRQEEIPPLLETAECYYKQGRSVSKASEQLFIHKNTLQYRLHRLLEAMELSGDHGFCQEFLVRLILQYIRSREQ